MMSKLRLQYLYQRYIDDNCTPEEMQELGALLKSTEYEYDLNELLDGTWDDLAHYNLNDVSEAKGEQIYQQIIEQPQNRTERKAFGGLWFKISAAASVTVLLSVSLLWYASHSKKTINPTQTARAKVRDVMPGGNKAILTLANGSSVVLDNAVNGQIAQQAGTVVKKVKDGQLIYAAAASDQNNLQAGVQWNTITIPRGGQYNLILADGTHVFLNSASSLTYPTGFTGSTREVTLKGEAYFEVAKNPEKPFKVNVNDRQQVEVLGTHFNIEAYTDEQIINTTLLEGSVKLLCRDKQAILKPGQIAVNNLDAASLRVKPADIDEVMAWTSGIFVFNNENITSIMKRISRWYDIDVVFKGNMADINFVGNYSRTKSLANLLKNIETTERVHFLMEGRRITVIAQ